MFLHVGLAFLVGWFFCCCFICHVTGAGDSYVKFVNTFHFHTYKYLKSGMDTQWDILRWRYVLFLFSTANNQNINKGAQLTKGVQTSGYFSPVELPPESELVCGDPVDKKERILSRIVSSIKKYVYIWDLLHIIHLSDWILNTQLAFEEKYKSIQKI